jgi:SAM-dependent methyltransferase
MRTDRLERYNSRLFLACDLPNTMSDSQRQTIIDFGEQWTRYTDNGGVYGSQEFFADIVSPLLDPSELSGKYVAEIGSGTGRIAAMMLGAGARKVMAIEPSAAYAVLTKNLAGYKDRVEAICATGEKIPDGAELDYVLSIGVLHHIPEPNATVRAALNALKPGGRMLIWLYGHEGNEMYLSLVNPLRKITKRIPHGLLVAMIWMIYPALMTYMWLCKLLPLPMRRYMLDVVAKMAPDKRRLIVYDQLNPAYAKYYTRSEAIRLLSENGFRDVRVHHRHGYSWTVIGTK